MTCKHDNTWFDRTLCQCQDGGAMHTVCADCGEILDGGRHAVWRVAQPPTLTLDEAGVERLAAAERDIRRRLREQYPDSVVYTDDVVGHARALVERLRGGA